jgi:hypothetical protein
MTAHVKDGGVWKQNVPYARDAGVWKPAKRGLARDAGVWKDFLPHWITVGDFTSGSASPATGTMAVPTPQAGDLMLMLYRQTSSGSDINIAGWTKLTTQEIAVGQIRFYVYGKLAVGTETSVPFNGSGNARIHYYRIRGERPITGFSLTGLDAGLSAGDPAAQVSDSNVGPPSFVTFGYWQVNSGVIDPAPFTIGGLAAEDEDHTDGFVRSKYKVFNPTTPLQQITVDMDDESDANYVVVFSIRLT